VIANRGYYGRVRPRRAIIAAAPPCPARAF
jgi:hypothetical protein